MLAVRLTGADQKNVGFYATLGYIDAPEAFVLKRVVQSKRFVVAWSRYIWPSCVSKFRVIAPADCRLTVSVGAFDGSGTTVSRAVALTMVPAELLTITL